MMRVYLPDDDRLAPSPGLPEDRALGGWIDLVRPTREEEELVERLTGIEVPTREEMAEIELSSRLYREDGAVFMTALVVAQADSEHFALSPVTFILAGRHLLTVRYHEPRAFAQFEGRLAKERVPEGNNAAALLMLYESIVDRVADIIERTARDIDAISARIFGLRGAEKAKGPQFETLLLALARTNDLVSGIRDSLATLDRAAGYFALVLPEFSREKALREQMKTLARDIRSLADHTAFLSQKITFLLDATLGLVNIEQNNIIKIFSIAAVVFLPPTLVASVYGMNFEHMPELEWLYGYPAALGLMAISAALPLLYFKRKGWL